MVGGGGSVGLSVIVVAALVAWVLSGIYIVDPAEEAAVLRFGKYVETNGPGPHWVPRFIETYEKVDVKRIRSQEIGFRDQGGNKGSVPHEALMLTQDENIIDLQFAVQYSVKSAADFLFNVIDPEITLRDAVESSVREIVGRTTMDFVITVGRESVAAEVQGLAQEILDLYETGLTITSVNMQNAQPPAQVQNAFFDAIKAREDQERIINEAKAYQADVVPKARGEAAAILEQSEAYKQRVIAQAIGETDRFLKVLNEYKKAPEITRERMYIETMEAVMGSSSKVMVDVKGGNSLMYLPLDRLIGQVGDSAGRSDNSFGSASTESAGGGDLDETRRSRDNMSGRARQ